MLCGPFRGEVGFEILYWLPWLQTLQLPPERLIPITRGGAHVWYHAREAMELYDLADPQAVRVENNIQVKATGLLKQTAWTPFDRAIVEETAKRLIRLKRYWTLHPHWMFRALAPYWEGRQGLAWLKSRQSFTPLPAPPLPIGLTLPEKFIAVRFYLRHTFPHHEATVALARAAVAQMASRFPVVLLDTGVHADEHVDLNVTGPNITRLADLVSIIPQNNLAVLSAVLARAQGFVGTYGGLAQLALRYGKPSVSFYANWGGTAIAHKHLADALSLETRVPFIVLNIADCQLLRHVVPEIVLEGMGRGSSGAQPTTAVVV